MGIHGQDADQACELMKSENRGEKTKGSRGGGVVRTDEVGGGQDAGRGDQ